MALRVLSDVNLIGAMNTCFRFSLWLLVLAFVSTGEKLCASDPSPPTFGYELRNPRPGQLDANHWKRQPWTGTVSNVAELPGGRLLISGPVRRAGTHGFTNLAVLDRFGWANTNAPRFLDSPAMALAAQPDGSVAIVKAGGREMEFLNPEFLADLRWAWPPEPSTTLTYSITCLAKDGSGGWLVGGIQETRESTVTNRMPFITRLRADGRVEPALAPDFVDWPANTGSVTAILPVAEGKLLVSLSLTPVGQFGYPSATVLRLLPGGFQDRSFGFQPRTGSLSIHALALAADGRIYVASAGHFSFPNVGGTYGLLRLNPDGSYDQTFHAWLTARPGSVSGPTIWSLAVDAAGRVLVGGEFIPEGVPALVNLARLFPDGSLDPSFVPGQTWSASGAVTRVFLDAEQRLVASGNFRVTDQVTRYEVTPPLPGISALTVSSSSLAILHNTDRPLAAPPRLTNGVFSVASYLPASGYLILERSADMVHWQGFRTNFAAGTNWLRASFPVGDDAGSEFYRVSVRP